MAGKQLTVARWGGEEFLLLFENCELADAHKILQKIHTRISEAKITYQAHTIRVTMSMGLVQADPSRSEDEMLKAADTLLYYCKEHGRNEIQAKQMTN